MKMVGIYEIALRADADEDAFVSHMSSDEFGAVGGVLQLTRVTSGFEHILLKRAAESPGLRRYAWHVTVRLVGDAAYGFDGNVERLQESIAQFGVVVGVEAYAVVAEQGDG